eukprot:CAMPEP_0204088910 /NCGR_PEP_ID=MMETSP0360-20130528/186972_1 /ASSEMBLY_ACC=CAM_ASM_000342 /TAXON_ID=268821 /ORGANISM="Scrippsiella Hangoei, Strain SHTV-5" /LENGTH=63 /DNA_ID=CAMNT_0051038109 /DNA_START=23 /DNA_END=211 /DNA_ORIENTATION=+
MGPPPPYMGEIAPCRIDMGESDSFLSWLSWSSKYWIRLFMTASSWAVGVGLLTRPPAFACACG